LFVDDTVAGFANVDVLSTADAVTSSLTKFFSGVGDVAGGSIVLNANGPFYADLKSALRAEYEDTVWAEDAVVLESNSRDYAERVRRINATASRVAAHLASRPEVEQVCYPELTDAARYNLFRKPAGGYSGLLSIILRNPAETAPRFFDALRVSKGPNLGTNFTLACPFTLLAHYTELDFAESCGVSRWLIRVSIGLEAAGDLIARFDAAL
jgi:cystathionine gamma-synthase